MAAVGGLTHLNATTIEASTPDNIHKKRNALKMADDNYWLGSCKEKSKEDRRDVGDDYVWHSDYGWIEVPHEEVFDRFRGWVKQPKVP